MYYLVSYRLRENRRKCKMLRQNDLLTYSDLQYFAFCLGSRSPLSLLAHPDTLYLA
jgi:hypothetical protein